MANAVIEAKEGVAPVMEETAEAQEEAVVETQEEVVTEEVATEE